MQLVALGCSDKVLLLVASRQHHITGRLKKSLASFNAEGFKQYMLMVTL